VQIRSLTVPDAFAITPQQHADERGVFMEWFSAERFERATGRRLDLAQANCSVSRRGVLRGIHFADVPPGQAKYVTCFAGRVLDVVIDIRVGSPTFSAVDSVVLDSVDRRAVFVAEGLGHAFMALSDEATVAYLCSTPYAPGREHSVHPLTAGLDLPWPVDVEPVLSDKDAAAPSLEEAVSAGLLPDFEECQAWYQREARATDVGPLPTSPGGLRPGADLDDSPELLDRMKGR
jgi:dTDP-4-dehydrorhamnose 3,5-epimerase